jgi:hypothetical protein
METLVPVDVFERVFFLLTRGLLLGVGIIVLVRIIVVWRESRRR